MKCSAQTHPSRYLQDLHEQQQLGTQQFRRSLHKHVSLGDLCFSKIFLSLRFASSVVGRMMGEAENLSNRDVGSRFG